MNHYHTRPNAEVLGTLAALNGQSPPKTSHDWEVKRSIMFCAAITDLMCKTLGHILKILCCKLEMFHIFLKIQHLGDPDKHSLAQLETQRLSSSTRGFGIISFLFPGGTLGGKSMVTFKLLKFFQLCVRYASDVQSTVRGCDVWGWDFYRKSGSKSCHFTLTK